MDPNEALKNAREALKRMQSARLLDDIHAEASDLADAFEALDEWLSRGGFLPADWQRNRD